MATTARRDPRNHCRKGFVLSAALVALGCLLQGVSSADETIISGLTWMSGFAPTWNHGAPKLVSDGLFNYAVVAGAGGDPGLWSIMRQRGIEGIWQQVAPIFRSDQPPVMAIDYKARLNVFFNNPRPRHYRFDHPSVDLQHFQEIPIPLTQSIQSVGYLNASYDATTDALLLIFNDSATLTLHFTVKYTDANAWAVPTALPTAPGVAYLYARILRARGRYVVLASEHPMGGPHANYTATILFESDAPFGPWQKRELYRVYGQNLGVPYQNWVFGLDMQQDTQGRVRVLLHINEDFSGHTPMSEGLHIAREEDNFSPRHIGGEIDDGFSLHIQPNGTMLALALLFSKSPIPHAGKLVFFQSVDGGLTWSPAEPVGMGIGVYTCTIQARDGSMLGGKEAGIMYSTPLTPPFHTVRFTTVPLHLADTSQRYDHWFQGSDGTLDYVRAYMEPSTGRSYYYVYDYAVDGSFSITYVYTASNYYQVYLARSDSTYYHYNSDGDIIGSYGYWFTDDDGSQDFIFIFSDPPSQVHWWHVYDYDLQGNWTQTYVYYRGSYEYVAIQHSDGSFVRYDSTGFYEAS
jgi:hypothetical protein